MTFRFFSKKELREHFDFIVAAHAHLAPFLKMRTAHQSRYWLDLNSPTPSYVSHDTLFFSVSPAAGATILHTQNYRQTRQMSAGGHFPLMDLTARKAHWRAEWAILAPQIPRLDFRLRCQIAALFATPDSQTTPDSP